MAGQEQFREAVRTLYLAILALLHRENVIRYERTRTNGGIVPDNVGPSGEIGELMDGKWWGGYYGWRWPHGYGHLLEPILIAASNALLLTGDEDH